MQPRLYSVLKDASARVQPISVHVAFLLIGVRGVRPFSAVLVSALFRLPCSISIHLSPRSVTAVVHPFPLAMQQLYSCVSQVCNWCPPFSAGHVAFYSFVSQVCHWWRPPLFRWPCSCWCPPFSAGHVAFLFICLPGLSLLLSTLFRWPCSICIDVSSRSVTGVRPFPLAM